MVITRHIRVNRRTAKSATAHLHPAVDPRRLRIKAQGDLEDQLCVPVVFIEGDSYRMRSHRARAEAIRKAAITPT